MRRKMEFSFKALTMCAITALSVLLTTACQEEVDTNNRFTFKGELIAGHLENNPQRFSKFAYILTRAKIGSKSSASIMKTLSTYGSYTCFAPTNEAVDSFIAQQYALYLEGERTGITSPILEELSDSMANVIARNHIIERGYRTIDINDGAFPKSTMNGRFTTVETINDEEGRVFPLLNSTSRIIDSDLQMENGYIQVIDKVLSPSNKLLPELIQAHTEFSIFDQAIRATRLDSLLNIYELDPDYDGTKESTAKLDSEASSSPVPKYKRQLYTVLIEPDSLLRSNGINDLNALIRFAEKWYGTEDQDDLTSPNNALYKYIAYHIIDRQLLYSSSTGPGGFIMENYINKAANFSSKVNLNQNFDSYEYYETMMPYTMIKVTKPYTNQTLKNEIIINYAQEQGTVCNNPEMSNHINVVVERAAVTKNKYPGLQDFNQMGLNGILHTIDRLLIYNEEEMAGNIFNERIRIDVSAIFPELTNNEVRWDLSSSGNLVTVIPDGFCKDFVVLNEQTEVFYFRPHQTWLGSYANYQGDEFIVEGKYDFKYRIPHVPAGTYEIRFGYPKGYYRGVCQFYVDGVIAGIPVDLRWNEATDILIGWSAVAGMSEEEQKESDKAMRNRGYMRGPGSIVLEEEMQPNGTMRDSEQALRKIIGTYRLEKGDHWLRFKDVSENSTGNLKQFDQDYLELVPTSVIMNPNKPEDVY